ncbi:MAG: hypothetical protein H7287_11730 [Thermoleophilia bacterium]|nr:hypothetical protein [Thermoleophilia bacterium]
MTTTEQQAAGNGGTAWRLLGAVVVAAALVAVAWWMTGSAPSPVDTGLPKSPPPMSLPVGTATNTPVAAAIQQLDDGKFVAATSAFTTLVANAPADPVAQTGLILSGWRSDGPIAVERDLAQLADEQPESAYVALHLGLVRILIGENDDAELSFRAAVQAGRAAGDPTSLRMARLGDDLLHPDGFRSYVPVLVQAGDVPAADRPALGRLLTDIERDDRGGAAKESQLLAKSASPMSRIAALVGLYEKGKEAELQAQLAPYAGASQPPAVRSRAQLHQGLAQLWSGSDRDRGCRLLAQAMGPTADDSSRQLATSISKRLCR